MNRRKFMNRVGLDILASSLPVAIVASQASSNISDSDSRSLNSERLPESSLNKDDLSTIDTIATLDEAEVISSNTIVVNIQELRAIRVENLTDGTPKKVLGYYTAGDINLPIYLWDSATSATDNGGNIIKPNSISPSQPGRWMMVPQSEASIKWFGAVGDGIRDDTNAIQNAINAFNTIYIPNGTYLISRTIREATTSYALRIIGENKLKALIKAADNFPTEKPMIWLGNSTGHGNYRAQCSFFGLDGKKRALGIRYHEAGTSEILSLTIKRCRVGIDCPGMIGSVIHRCEISRCDIGINLTRPAAGKPSSLDDTKATASPLPLSNNINTISENWIAGGSGPGIHVEGGLTTIQGNTFQSQCRNAQRSVVELVNANESLTYGGGPIVSGNWFEGGSYIAAIFLKNTRKTIIRENFIVSKNCEASIFGDKTSSETTVMMNSFLYRGSTSPTSPRTQNANVYLMGPQSSLIQNHYSARNNKSYSDLIVVDTSTSAQNYIVELGQNNNSGFGLYFGNIEITSGAAAKIKKNSLISEQFNFFLQDARLQNCTHDELAFSNNGPKIIKKPGKPIASDATSVGDLCIDTTNANLYIHVGRGAWKKFMRES